MICFMQFLYAEANPNRPLLKCDECPIRERCKGVANGNSQNQDIARILRCGM